jgi:hypothetical protein
MQGGLQTRRNSVYFRGLSLVNLSRTIAGRREPCPLSMVTVDHVALRWQNVEEVANERCRLYCQNSLRVEVNQNVKRKCPFCSVPLRCARTI